MGHDSRQHPIVSDFGMPSLPTDQTIARSDRNVMPEAVQLAVCIPIESLKNLHELTLFMTAGCGAFVEITPHDICRDVCEL